MSELLDLLNKIYNVVTGDGKLYTLSPKSPRALVKLYDKESV